MAARTALHIVRLAPAAFAAGVIVVLACLAGTRSLAATQEGAEAQAIVRDAFQHYRGDASYARMRMTIHRPEWERTQELEAWTRGESDAVIILTAPARDRGNGTLKQGEQMWTFNPRINRVIKLPPSLMSQSWMGSDFTNHDLARSDTILVDYTHAIIGVSERDGHVVRSIRLTPRPGAPVVWGYEEMDIRADHVVLEERFFDQDGVLVKRLVATEIEVLGGRVLPRIITMHNPGEPDRFTRVEYAHFEFREGIPDRLFSEAFLRNPRE